jgi:toxin ParE1/3/4
MFELFLPEADAELREAARYYESESPGLGLSFVTAVHKAISLIMENPMVAPLVGSDIRSKVVGRFPYNLMVARKIS